MAFSQSYSTISTILELVDLDYCFRFLTRLASLVRLPMIKATVIPIIVKVRDYNLNKSCIVLKYLGLKVNVFLSCILSFPVLMPLMSGPA